MTINGGTVSAAGTGTVELNGATVNAPVNNSTTGTISVTGSPSTVGALTNPAGGQVNVAGGAALTLPGATSNGGTITMDGSEASLTIGASNVTLSGSGTLTMGGNSSNYISGALSTDTLTNQSTIQGAGNIGEGSMGFINAGTVLANQSTPLVIDPSSTGFTNNGVLQVKPGSTLQITGGPFTNFSGTTLTGGTYYVAGTLQFGASGSSVTTDNANLTLSGSGATLLDLGNNNLLAGLNNIGAAGSLSVVAGGGFTTGGNLTNSGTTDLEQGSSLKVSGALTNNGILATNDQNLQGGANTLTVTGKVTNNAGATVTVGADNDTSDTAKFASIANSGTLTVGTGATLTLTSTTASTDPGAIDLSGTLASKGSITLSGTGSVTLTGGSLTATGTNETLKTAAKNTIQGAGTISGFGITNAGTLSANQASPLILLTSSAGLTNTGTIAVSAGDTMQIGTSAGGALTNFSGTTLTGGTYNLTGTMQFGASGTTIATNAANITLNGTAQMLDFGDHNILAGLNDNSSTGVFKLASSAALTTSGGSFTNAGTFTVSKGTTFTVGGSSFNFTQTGGVSTVDGTLTSSTAGTLSLNGGTLAGEGTLGLQRGGR